MFALDHLTVPGTEPVSLSLEPGECLGLSGESGCGKSRLLRAIADMDEHGGTASLDGLSADEVNAPRWRRQVALLPAESQWWADHVGEHFPGDGIDYAALGFPDGVTGWDISRCSSGEKQRLAVLRLLANRPKVLLLDEATANLDPDNVIAVERLVKEYLAANAACCIWVSHNALQLERVADRQMVFRDGHVEMLS